MKNMPDDKVVQKPPAISPSPSHTQRFRVPERPQHERTGMYISHEGVADLTLKRVHEARLTQEEIAKTFSAGGQAATSVKNIFRNAVVEEDRLSRFVQDDNGKPVDIDSIRGSLVCASEFATSARFDHPEGGTSLRMSVAILYCNEPVARRFLISNAPISVLGALEKTAELDVKFYSCITGRRSITLAGKPGEYRHIYLATPEIERAVLGMCERYPAADSTPVHLEEARHSSASAPVIDLPAPAKAQDGDDAFMTENERTARKRETSIPAPAKSIAPPARVQAPRPEAQESQKATLPKAPAAQEAPMPAQEAAPAGKRIATNTLGLSLEGLDGRRKVGNEADLKKMFDTPYSFYTITTEGGRSIRAAEETRFVTFLGESPEYLQASDLEKGDVIYRKTKAGPVPERIVGIRKSESRQGVSLCRIRVGAGQMLFADGFAVSGAVSLLPEAAVDTPSGGRKAGEMEIGAEAVSFSNDEYGTSPLMEKFGLERGFIFRGMEIELTSGMRLLMLPIHPQTLADKCPAVLDYADTQRYTEVEYENGKKVYYVLVKQRESASFGFSLTPMENTLQVLEDAPIPAAPAPSCLPDPVLSLPEPFEPAPQVKQEESATSAIQEAPAPAIQKAAPEAPAAENAEPHPPEAVKAEPLPAQAEAMPEPSAELATESPREAMAPPGAEQVREEAFGEVREFASGLLRGSPVPPIEILFGGNIAILVQAEKSQYLVTNAEDWNAAREAMQEHLSSGAEGVLLTEIQTAYARKKKPLRSGGEVTIFVKPVGRSRAHKGERGESHSDTMEMMPKKDVDAAISKSDAKKDPEAGRRRMQTIDLIRGAVLPLAETSNDMLDIFMEPESISEAKPSPERWYLLATASNGREYAIFRFPCEPKGLSRDVSGMPAAVVFTNRTNPGYSYLMIETKFLSPALTEMMLSSWKA